MITVAISPPPPVLSISTVGGMLASGRGRWSPDSAIPWLGRPRLRRAAGRLERRQQRRVGAREVERAGERLRREDAALRRRALRDHLDRADAAARRRREDRRPLEEPRPAVRRLELEAVERHARRALRQ